MSTYLPDYQQSGSHIYFTASPLGPPMAANSRPFPIQRSTTGEEASFEGYAAFHRRRVEETIALISQFGPPAGPVLDVGASPLSSQLPRIWTGREVHVLDPDTSWNERLRCTEVHFHEGSLMDECLPLPEGAFAVTLASEVFEHLPECPEHLLNRLARVTAPGGIVGVTIPNQARLVNRVRLLLGRSILEAPSSAYHRPWMGYGHLHEYTLGELRTDFHDPGLRPVALGAIDPYDRGRFNGPICLMKWLHLTGWREVLYVVFRRVPEGEVSHTLSPS